MERETIQAVRDATSIRELVNEHTQLQGAGEQLKGVCPIHDDNDPSLYVHPGKNIWYCHGCHKGGDAIQFVMDARKLSFLEAVDFLAERAGVAVELNKERFAALATSSGEHIFFGKNLWTNEKPELEHKRKMAIAYLESRKVTPETAQLFELGMTNYGHISFPFMNEAGNVTGHAYRPATDNQDDWDNRPKYYNDRNGVAFNKSQSLFGVLHPNCTDNVVHLVEGYFDAIAMWMAGSHAYAIGGTALTPEQAKKIARKWPQVVLYFDGDNAGHEATLRAIPILYKAGVKSVRVLRPSEGSDPWSMVFTEDRPIESTSMVDGYDYLVTHLPDDPAQCIREIRPILEHLQYEDRFAIYQRVGARSGMPQALFTYKKRAPAELFAPPHMDPNIESILKLLIHRPGIIEPLVHLEPDHVDDPSNGCRGEVRDVIYRLMEEEEILSIMDDIDAEDLKKNLARIASNAEEDTIELAAKQAACNLAVKWLTKEIWRVAKTDPMAAIELQRKRLFLMEENRGGE